MTAAEGPRTITVTREGNGTYELTVRPEWKDGEPRVRDLDLAALLETKDPHKIRSLIRKHLDRISPAKVVSARQAETSSKGGRPGTEFWLTEREALFIASQSRTPKALDLTQRVIDVFVQARRGMLTPPAALPPAPPPTTFPPLTPEESSSIATELLSAASVVKAELSDLLERARRDGSIRRVTLERALAPHALHRRCSVDDLVDKIVAAWLSTAEPRVVSGGKPRG